ncbi:MAG: LPS export ABC transporter permease LptF [Gammaproteobacteria bacterium]
MIIDRYLARQVTQSLIGVSVVLLLIFISGQLVSLFGKVASGTLQANTILMLLGLNSLSNLVFVLPLSFYLAILLAFTRLYQDNEMVVLTACGIGQVRVLRGLLFLIVIFAALVGWLSLHLAPWAEARAQEIVKAVEESSDLQGIVPGRFKELSRGIGVIYVEKVDGDGRMQNVFLQQEGEDGDLLIRAERAYAQVDAVTGHRFMVLENGHRYAGKPGVSHFSSVTFERHGIRMTESDSSQPLQLRYKAVPTATLWTSTEPHLISELQWRISAPIVCILLALLAIPLSRTSNRQGRYGKLAIAILLYIIYTNLLNVSRAWVTKGEIAPSLGLWWVHVLVIIFALLLWWRQLGLPVIKLRRTKRQYA